MKTLHSITAILLFIAMLLVSCGQSEPNKKYSLSFNGDSLYIVIQSSDISSNETDLRLNSYNTNASTLVSDVFQTLKNDTINKECSLFIRIVKQSTDKYGNTIKNNDDSFLTKVPIEESRKYKSAKYFDDSYSISQKILDIIAPSQKPQTSIGTTPNTSESNATQVQQSVQTNVSNKEYDFMMNVLANPNFSIGKFLSAGLNPNNAQLQDINVYLNSNNVREDYKRYVGEPTYENIQSAYYKIQSAWNILKEVYANYDISTIRNVTYSGTAHRDNIFAKDVVDNNSDLARKLSIIPLNQ